jgi:Zn-finger nucleic acid-binding protein
MPFTKIEALNCPNCGAAVSSDSTQCQFCRSRLKTLACPKCLGLMFLGSLHCTHCGAKTVPVEVGEGSGACPRCKQKLVGVEVGELSLQECERCGGMWTAADSFENLCADNERQAAVLTFISQRTPVSDSTAKISYVPCPQCNQLMNRSNFARSSGVIIDLCKGHGVWFDADELPKIIAFIRQGGIDKARQRERLELKEERDRLRSEQQRNATSDAFYRDDAEDQHSGLGSVIDFLLK